MTSVPHKTNKPSLDFFDFLQAWLLVHVLCAMCCIPNMNNNRMQMSDISLMETRPCVLFFVIVLPVEMNNCRVTQMTITHAVSQA